MRRRVIERRTWGSCGETQGDALHLYDAIDRLDEILRVERSEGPVGKVWVVRALFHLVEQVREEGLRDPEVRILSDESALVAQSCRRYWPEDVVGTGALLPIEVEVGFLEAVQREEGGGSFACDLVAWGLWLRGQLEVLEGFSRLSGWVLEVEAERFKEGRRLVWQLVPDGFGWRTERWEAFERLELDLRALERGGCAAGVRVRWELRVVEQVCGEAVVVPRRGGAELLEVFESRHVLWPCVVRCEDTYVRCGMQGG